MGEGVGAYGLSARAERRATRAAESLDVSELLMLTEPSFLTWILVDLNAETRSFDRAPAASREWHPGGAGRGDLRGAVPCGAFLIMRRRYGWQNGHLQFLTDPEYVRPVLELRAVDKMWMDGALPSDGDADDGDRDFEAAMAMFKPGSPLRPSPANLLDLLDVGHRPSLVLGGRGEATADGASAGRSCREYATGTKTLSQAFKN